MSGTSLSRRGFLGCAAAAPLAMAQEARRPNIVFILSDDMGWADIGANGAKDIRTPNIDKLARQGIRFTNAYSNGCLCSPTRTAFLTGRYPARFGIETALVKQNPAHLKLGIPDSEPTVAQLFKQNGYATAIFGKWHAGFEERFRPTRRGFDEFFGFLGGAIDFYSHKERSGDDDFWEGNSPIQREGYTTELFADRAVDFINRKAKQPFFLYLPFNAVHWPFQPPGKPSDVRTAKTYVDGNRQDYKLMLESMDAAIGRVLDALDKNGVANNTLVVFTNDNGGERFSDNGPYFHYKGTLWEGGIRVPAIARWPGRLKAGSVSHEPIATFDFTASFLAAAGIPLPEGKKLDGVDVLQSKPKERTLFWRFDQAQGGRRQWAVRRGKWKLIRDGSNAVPPRGATDLLFDLEADPQERHNLALRNPELVAELREVIRIWEQELPAAPNTPGGMGGRPSGG